MVKKENKIHHGGCHCGSIRYQAKGVPVVVAHCHCKDCQRLSGAGHSTGAMFSAIDVQLSGPVEEYLLDANNGNGVTKGFCGNCGSQIFGRNNGSPDYITIALGAFDDPSAFDPQVVIFARNKMHWDVMDKGLATFETQPDWNPDDGV